MYLPILIYTYLFILIILYDLDKIVKLIGNIETTEAANGGNL